MTRIFIIGIKKIVRHGYNAIVGNGGIMLICNKCGKTGKRGNFCVYCGGELSEFFTIKTVETDAEPTAECPECGKKFADGKFCIFCGTALRTIGGAAEDNETVVQEIPAANETPVVEEPAPAVNEAPAEGGQLACVECGKIHERGKFCTACGGALRPVGAAVEAPAANETLVVEEPAPAVNEVPAEGGALVCPACGKVHERGKFCTVCGTSLEPMGTAPQPAPFIAPPPAPIPSPVHDTNAAPASGLVCPNCGKTFERGKFCTVCGTTLVAQNAQPAAPANSGQLHCSQCGKIFERGKFCTVCGGMLVTSDMMNV